MAVLPSLQNLRSVLQSVLFVPFAYTFFFNMMPFFLTAWENADRLDNRFADTFRTRQNTYDFIIVGGGTSGALVANRLSEYYSVLLLDTGGTSNPMQLVPGITQNFLNQQQVDWGYRTQPQQRACLNSISQQSSWSVGRTLGGSSTLGYMTYMRGSPLDFDNWAMITGDRTWSYTEVLPFFRRFEEFVGLTTDTSARGDDGELRIRNPDYRGLGNEWIQAGEELGYNNVDFNGRYTEGFGIVQYPIRRGMRQSTYDAFIRPIRMGPRLRILPHSFVTRILFRDMSNMAYGVEFQRFGLTELAVASREVILCAGTIGTPKLLMLSGIGPRTHLESIGIPVRRDLPVGRNLQDHLGVQLGPFHVNSTSTYLLDREVTPENIVLWIAKGLGPLTTSGIQGAGAFTSTIARSRGEQNWPDLLLLLQGQAVHGTYAQDFSRAFNLQEDEIVRYYENSIGRDSFHIRVIGARPTSSGSILLSSANPTDPVIINPRYLEDNGAFDLRVLQEGIQTALRLVENSTAFRGISAEFTSNRLPGCDSQEFKSEAYWKCYIQRFTLSQHNPVGTAAIGAVVDSDLKVRGTRGLRVIDASVMPTLVSVGTLPATLMIAEKASDAILREYGTQRGNTGIGDAVFGRNGIIAKNPVQRYLSRELDKLNPLPALFRIPQGLKDFNPFSRFLHFFGFQGSSNPLMILLDLFSRPGTAVLNLLRRGQAGGNFGTNQGTGTNSPMGLLSILGQLFPSSTQNRSQQTRSIFDLGQGGRDQGNNNVALPSIFDFLFPRPKTTTTTTTAKPTILNGNNLINLLFPNITLNSKNLSLYDYDPNYNIFGTKFSPNNSQNLIQNLFNNTNVFDNLLLSFNALESPSPNLFEDLMGTSKGLSQGSQQGNNNSSSVQPVGVGDVDNENRTIRDIMGPIPNFPILHNSKAEERAEEIQKTFNATASL